MLKTFIREVQGVKISAGTHANYTEEAKKHEII